MCRHISGGISISTDMIERDGHIRVLPLHVANKIAAGEVVERPASVVKELVENAIDAGARNIAVAIAQGGRKLVSVRDDGCGMTREDALLSLERQATSKILDVDDIEQIDTLGFRGEAIPSIASVSRFSITTRRSDSDEGTFLAVNAGTVAEVRSAGAPPGTLVEVRDLFCNVPARRKFLRAYQTEESHVKHIFTVHALAHPQIGFTLTVDGRELYRLAPSESLSDRIRDLFGAEILESLLSLCGNGVAGYIERPNQFTPTRREQYVFVNGRPATAPSIAYALREAYPRHQGDVKPAAFIFLTLPPGEVDVNVHPTKREVRFRNGGAVKLALMEAIAAAVRPPVVAPTPAAAEPPCTEPERVEPPASEAPRQHSEPFKFTPQVGAMGTSRPTGAEVDSVDGAMGTSRPTETPAPAPVQVEMPLLGGVEDRAKPWAWFRFLAMTESGYLLIETDAGVVTINPHAARERLAYEQLLGKSASQQLLIPETVQLSPTDASRLTAALETVNAMGFSIEPFGGDTFKVEAVPQLIGSLAPAAILTTIVRDLSEGAGARRSGERWREELIAKSIARSFAGASMKLDEQSATRLVEELAASRMPYVCPRGKPIMIFTSTRELDRRFAR